MLLALCWPPLYPSVQISAVGRHRVFMLQALNPCWRFPTSSLNSPIGLDPRRNSSSALASMVPGTTHAAASSLSHSQGTAFPEKGMLLLSNQFSKLNGWAEETQIWTPSSYVCKYMRALNKSNGLSINTALFLLASFFQLIPVTYINVTFTFIFFIIASKQNYYHFPMSFKRYKHLNQCLHHLNERREIFH